MVRRSAPGDQSLIELDHIGPGGPVQGAGDGQAGQALDLPNILIGLSVIAAVHLAGAEVGHHRGEGAEHGLDDAQHLALLALHGGVAAVGQHIEGGREPIHQLHVDIGVPDGVPGGQIHHAGDGKTVLPLEHHDGLQGALAKDAVHRQPGENVVVDGQLIEHVLKRADGLSVVLGLHDAGRVRSIHCVIPSFQLSELP